MTQEFVRQDTLAVFENPHNGYRESVPRRAWLWTMLFGVFYLMARRLWMHVAIVWAVLIACLWVSPSLLFWIGVPLWIFYIRKTADLTITSYYRRGWRAVPLDEATLVPDGSL